MVIYNLKSQKISLLIIAANLYPKVQISLEAGFTTNLTICSSDDDFKVQLS